MHASLVLLVLAAVAGRVQADLPIHCLRHQIEGRWKFYLGEWTRTPFPNCKQFKQSDAAHTVHVDLPDPESKDFGTKGSKWSAVYDEAMNVVFNHPDGGKAVSFSFFKWRKVGNGMSESFCGRTAPGLAWFNNGLGIGAPTKWGCFIGEKVEPVKTTTFPASPDLLAEVPHVTHAADPEDEIDGVYEERHTQNITRVTDPNQVIDEKMWRRLVDEINTAPGAKKWHAKVYPHLFVGKTRRELELMAGGRLYNPFAALKRASVQGKTVIHSDNLIAENENENENVFDGVDRRDRDRDSDDDDDESDGDDDDQESDDAGDADEDQDRDQDQDDSAAALDVSDSKSLPENFSWRNVDGEDYVPAVPNQGSCGSCFAVATIHALSARTRILTKNKWRVTLSPQYALDCSSKTYAQGCDGGFPFALSKWVHDAGGVALDECSTYHGKGGGGCKRECKKAVTAINFHYIGGVYGAGDDVNAIMQEVHRNGPIPVALEVGSEFMSYGGGVFSGHLHKKLKRYKEDHMELTNHAVLLVGWGTSSDGTKYWTLRNSWGKSWGEDGYIRVERGKDIGHVESMPVTLEPYILDPDWKHYNKH